MKASNHHLRNLDVLVGEHVFGGGVHYKYLGKPHRLFGNLLRPRDYVAGKKVLPYYSTTDAAFDLAFRFLDALPGRWVSLTYTPHRMWYCSFYDVGDKIPDAAQYADSPYLAVTACYAEFYHLN